MQILFFLVIFNGILRNSAYYNIKPDFLQICDLNDKNFVNCSTTTVQNLFTHIRNGLPDIGLLPIDPFKMAKLNIFQGKGLVSVNASLTNVTVHGFGNTIVKKNIVNTKTYDFLTKILVPKIKLIGQYSMMGQILIIPLRGFGNCWFEADDLDIIVKSDVTTYPRDEFIFFNITKVTIQFSIGGLRLHLGNLFNGVNKALEKSTNAYLNANWKIIAESLLPVLNETIEKIILEIFQIIFNNIPANYFLKNVTSEI